MSGLINPFVHASGGPGGPARYWRIYVNANGGAAATAIHELQLYESEFGPNVAAGGTASASSFVTAAVNYTADRAFNQVLRDNGTTASLIHCWAGNTDSDEWLKYDFGAGNEKEIVAIGMHGRISTWVTQMPTDFEVQYSLDDVTWFTAWAQTGVSWSSREFKRFVKPGVSTSYTGSPWGAHTYWRLGIIKSISGSNAPAMAEIENRATPSGADQNSGGTASASSIFSGSFPASNAYDNSVASLWSAANNSSENEFCWNKYQHAAPVEFAELVLTARNDTAANTSPANFAWQFSDDNVTWTTVLAQRGLAAWSLGETRTYTDPNYI